MFESNNLTGTAESGAMSGATYASAARTTTRDTDNSGAESGVVGVKPIFLKGRDVPEGKPLYHDELYMAIHKHLGSAANLKGLQRIGGLWRIYFSDRADRIALISSGLNIRGVSAPIYDTNPFVRRHDPMASIRVIIKDIPLSVHDEVIINEIEKQKHNVLSKVLRLRLRIDGQLTNCHTGDRMLFIEPTSKPLPRVLNMSGFKARIFHDGQEKKPIQCSKCLAEGHHASVCINEIVCRKCSMVGHKAAECTRDGIVDNLGQEANPTSSSVEPYSNNDAIESTSQPSSHKPDHESNPTSQKPVTQNDIAARNVMETHRAQSKITKFTIPSEGSIRSSSSQKGSESDDDDFQDVDTHGEEEEPEHSEMSPESPKLQLVEGKKYTGVKRKQKSKSRSSKKK